MIPQHAIRPNDSARQPRRFLWLDTESVDVEPAPRRVQRWRMGVTAFDGWDEHHGRPREVAWRRHERPEDLWAYVNGVCRRRSRVVLTCHNLAFDLRIARAFHLLPAMGWSIWRLGLHDRAMTVTWRREDAAALVMVDSLSWLPMGLAEVGKLIGVEKMPSPPAGDTEGWWARCESDVAILRDAMRACWGWVADTGAGTWQRTGAGMAQTHWRHLHYTHRVVVHDSEDAREAESSSTYAGRCEAWRWGPLPRRSWYEYDLPLAHARIATEAQLPVALVAAVGPIALDRALDGAPRWRYLCRATVDQASPVLPVKLAEGVVWPTGRVEGWWWERELGLARAEGAEVAISAAWRYAAAPALASWARWAVEAVEGGAGELPPVVRAMVKHWTRALFGRFATRYQRWERLGPGLDGEVVMMPCLVRRTGELGHLLMLGNECRVSTGERYGSDACLGIWSAILAECRVRLWRVMRAAGLDHVAYVDTDSVLVDAEGMGRLEAAIAAGELWGLRRKGRTSSVEILGPRQLRFGRSSRFAGVPVEGRRLKSGEWSAERWETIRGALENGRADEVVVTGATWVRHATDRRRLHLPGGYTDAHALVDGRIVAEAPQIVSDGLDPLGGPPVAAWL